MRVRLSWSLLVFSVCLAAGVASGGTLTVTLDTGVFSADAGSFAFDLIDGDGAVDNTVTLTGFVSDAELEPSVLTGSVTGDVPGPVTFSDGEFFSELLVPVTTFGGSTRFTLQYTNVAGSPPDEFSIFLLDPAAVNSLVTTNLPGDALLTITLAGDSATAVAIASSIAPAVTVTRAPEPSALALLLLAGAALGGLLARRSLARTVGLGLVFALALAGFGRAQDGFEIPDSQLHASFSGYVLNRATNTWDTTASFSNTSPGTFTGQFSIVLSDILPTTATLANPSCKTADGRLVLLAAFPPAGLAPGATFSDVVIRFNNPKRGKLKFTQVVIQGDVCIEDSSLHAFSDSRALPDPNDVSFLLAQVQPLYCLSQPAAPMTLAQAMTSLQTTLDQLAGPGSLATFMADNAQTNAADLAALAATAMIDGKTPGALAALLVAHHNDPNSPAHLASAAGAAELMGKPNEALALLDAADALGGNFGAPMGVSGVALAKNNRGYAMLQTGQFAQAQALFSAAAGLEPFLSEARFNLAVAMLCQGEDATGPYLQGLKRSPPQTLDLIFDLSHGVGPSMPNIPYPAIPNLLRKYANLHGSMYQATIDKSNALLLQRDDVFSQLAQQEQSNPPPNMEIVRAADIFNAGDLMGVPSFDETSPPGLGPLYDVMVANKQAVVDLNNQLFAQFLVWANKRNDALLRCTADLPYCSAEYQNILLQGRTQVRQGLSQLLRTQGRFDQATRAFANPWYHAVTGLAANLSDPLRHKYRSLQARIDQLAVFNNLVANGGFTFGSLASWWEEAQGSDAPGDLTLVPPDPVESSACGDSIKGAKIKFDLPGFLEYSANCEKLDITIKEPGLGPFAQLTLPRSGDWTVFAGAQGELVFPDGKVGSKVGFFIKGNDQGYTDAGFKSSTDIGIGPLRLDAGVGFEAGIVAASQCFLGCD